MNFKTLSTAALISCTLVPNMASASVVQWSSGTGANSHYYMTTDIKTTWTDANSLAQSLGGYLVSITSADEQKFLMNSFLPSYAKIAYWIGLTDEAKEGTFVWTTGEAFSYQNFHAGHADDYRGGITQYIGEDYAAINWHYTHNVGAYGSWDDLPDVGCTNSPYTCAAAEPLGAIIEFDHDPTVSVPEPAPLAFAAIGLMGIAALRRRKEAQ